MAKATAPGTVKAAAPKKAKAKVIGSKNKAARGKQPALEKAPTPKMAPAPKQRAAAKSMAPVGKKAAVVKEPLVPKKAPVLKEAPVLKKAASGKVAVRVVAVKKAAPRRPGIRTAVPTPASRRGRAPVTARKAVARKLDGAGGSQSFTVSHLDEADFKAAGLRAYALYRDLGIAAATAGLCQAHVIRFVSPCTDEVRKRHVHSTTLQLVYVLRGWIKNEFEGHGEQMMSTGSCWLQPSGIHHTVLDYSPDCEVLEIIVPADFTTDDI